MTAGTVKTKGTRLYFGATESEIYKVACATGITGLGGAGPQINKTCLESEEEEFERGMKAPGVVTVPFNTIPKSAAHQALQRLDDSGDTVPWMIVLSDQAGAPTTIDSDGLLVSPGPTTRGFLGYVADYVEDFATNEIVRGTLTIQRSGRVFRDNPGADLP